MYNMWIFREYANAIKRKSTLYDPTSKINKASGGEYRRVHPAADPISRLEHHDIDPSSVVATNIEVIVQGVFKVVEEPPSAADPRRTRSDDCDFSPPPTSINTITAVITLLLLLLLLLLFLHFYTS